MARALIILANGFTDSEGTHALDRCREEDIVVHVATPSGLNPVGEKGWDRIRVTISTAEALGILGGRLTWWSGLSDLWDILILPGGVKSIEKLRLDTATIEIIQAHHKAGKIIASMCHGAQLLIEAGLCRGRAISGYYSIKTDIINAGGSYSGVEVVRDRNIISAPHYDFNGKWMGMVIKAWKETQQ